MVGSFLVPMQRLNLIARNSLAQAVHRSQLIFGGSIALLRCSPKPLNCQFVVFGNAVALSVCPAQLHMSSGVAGVRLCFEFRDVMGAERNIDLLGRFNTYG